MFRTAAIVFISLMLIFHVRLWNGPGKILTDFTDLLSDKATAENIHTIADFWMKTSQKWMERPQPK